MTPIEEKVEEFVESLSLMPGDPVPGSRVLGSIAAKVVERGCQSTSLNYNERYIEGGPKWGEHMNYYDGGQHGKTYRDTR